MAALTNPNPSAPTGLLLRDAKVVDVAEGRVAVRDVLVRGNRIDGVLDHSVDRAPAGVDVIDLPGCWITPGLFDMHCHLALTPGPTPPLSMFLDNGVIGIRDPGGPITTQRAIRESVASGEVDGPRLWISGEILDGTPPVWPAVSAVVDDAHQARATMRSLADRGADFFKVYNNITKDVLRTILDEAAQLGLPVIGHVPRSLGMREAVRGGLQNLEHVRIAGCDFLPEEEARRIDSLPVTEREPRLWSLIDVEAPWVASLIDDLVEHDVTLDPTLVVDEVVFGDRAIDISHPDNLLLPDSVRLAWETNSMVTGLVVTEEARALVPEGRARLRNFVVRCVDAGVRIVVGTDGVGLGRLLPGFGVHHELALLRDAGLSGMQALAAATLNAAQALGVDDEYGTVTPGKAADLAVWSADPLTTHLRPEDLRLLLVNGTIRRSG